ncbi:CelD/BcsL family acetyltransferase involved in cellulose biosynthesis [Paraburkholderia terricola]|uniref:GNAT family N-acetyltransferase n=1 Tax=Paraburkholderia terricola TaxID=169427 RepID=UPI00285FF26F|nr:GNAT family N-acetyltransferase [Paraburkholderia terricola]MDR6444969.1 CelD/BcsL family acetyltransferase involved in cellulose biosynthesis [Paraburkholderia terricola]
MHNPKSHIEIISDVERFRALKNEWEDLWSRANGHYHEAFAVCWESWLNIAEPRGSKLRCIVGRQNGRLVMVWPLVVTRRALWRVLRMLGPEAADYTSMLLDPEADAQLLVDQAWRAAMKHCGADVLRVPYLDERSRLHRIISSERHIVFGEQRSAAIARLRAETDWGSFAGPLGTLSGKKPGALERRLAKQGKLEARLLSPDEAERNRELVDWTLSRKREWASRVDKRGAWLYSAQYRDFLVSLLNTQAHEPAARLYLITLDDVPLATTIIGIGKSSIKGLLTGFDQRYAKYSPGQLVVEYMVKWAFDHRLDFDFGVGSESFKSYWSRNNAITVASAEVAATAWGRVAFCVRKLISRNSALVSRLRQPSFAENDGATEAPDDGECRGEKRQPARERRNARSGPTLVGADDAT